MSKLIPLKAFLIGCLVIVMFGCASTPPPPPNVLSQVEIAINRAIEAGAQQHAPVELKFAMDRFEFAKNVAIPEEDYELANWRLNEAQLNAELAFVKTQGELARAEEDAAAKEVERLENDLATEFGESR